MAHQPPEQAHLPSTYRELYSAAAYQSGEPAPTHLLASYRFTEAAGGSERPIPAGLIELTFAFRERRSMTFLCLLRTTDIQTEVRVLHRMIRYLELPGVTAGGVTDMSMGILGDVSAAQVPTVVVDNTHFSLVVNAGVRVPTVATMADHLDTAPPGVSLGPFEPEVPGTEIVGSRIMQVIPARYASVLVHGTGLRASAVYTEIYGMLEADDMLEACSDVLAWLRVAATAWGGAGELSPLPAVAQHFPLVLMPANASLYVADKVGRDLPGRATNGTTPTPRDDGMAAVVRQLAENLVSERGTRDVRGVAEAYRKLTQCCNVSAILATLNVSHQSGPA